jgi:hypothetical protein
MVYQTAYNRLGITHTASTSTITIPIGTWNGFLTKSAGTSVVFANVVDFVSNGSNTLTLPGTSTNNDQFVGVITRTA